MRIKCRIIIFLATLCLLGGCSSEPPDAAELAELLSSHRSDFELVADYLRSLDREYVTIYEDDGLCFYELSFHEIDSEEVKSSIHRLWREGFYLIGLGRNEESTPNTIHFNYWHHTVGGRSCGLACTVDGTGEPKAEFQISSEEIEPGWFYWYADYEKYRTGRYK